MTEQRDKQTLYPLPRQLFYNLILDYGSHSNVILSTVIFPKVKYEIFSKPIHDL